MNQVLQAFKLCFLVVLVHFSSFDRYCNTPNQFQNNESNGCSEYQQIVLKGYIPLQMFPNGSKRLTPVKTSK